MNTNTQKIDFHSELSILPDHVKDFFSIFKINTLVHDHLHRKRSGYQITYLLLVLITLPFYGINLFQFCKSNKNKIKDSTVFYNFLNNINNCWRTLIYKIAIAFIDYMKEYINKTKNKIEIIFAIDSSSVHKECSRHTGFLGFLWDHTIGRLFLGYEITPLLCIYNGIAFVLDFIFKSNTKEDNILIDKDDIKLKNSASLERRKECFKSIPKSIVSMVDRAISYGIHPDYIVADSWYSTKYFIKSFYERKLNYITMLKDSDTIFIYRKKNYTIEELRNILKPTTARKYNKYFDILGHRIVYVKITNKNKNCEDLKDTIIIPVKIVFTAVHSDHSKWSAFLSTNKSIPLEKILDVYTSRWKIEVFFKTAKQTLKLNKQYQGRNFDGFISTISILIIQHYLLLFYIVNNNYKTSNENFEKLANEIKYYYHDTTSLNLWKEHFDMVEELYTNNEIGVEKFIKCLNTIKNDIDSAIFEGRSSIVESKYVIDLVLQIDEYLYQVCIA